MEKEKEKEEKEKVRASSCEEISHNLEELETIGEEMDSKGDVDDKETGGPSENPKKTPKKVKKRGWPKGKSRKKREQSYF